MLTGLQIRRDDERGVRQQNSFISGRRLCERYDFFSYASTDLFGLQIPADYNVLRIQSCVLNEFVVDYHARIGS